MYEKWKEELQMIRLSEQQQQKIIRNLHVKPKIHVKLPQIVMPLIIIVAAMLLTLGLPSSQTVQSTTNASLLPLQPINFTLIIWATVANLFVVTNYVLFLYCVQYVRRIKANKFVRIVKACMQPRKFWLLVSAVLIICLICWLGVFILPFNLLWLQCIVALLFVPFVLFIQLLMTRNRYWPICPHCEAKVTRSNLRKRGFTGEVRPCDACGEKMFENGKMKRTSMKIYFFAPIILIGVNILPSLLLVPALLFVVEFIVMFIVTFKYIEPYMLKFEKTDDYSPLW